MTWLDSLFSRAGLWRTECCGILQSGHFSPFPARSPRDFFFSIHCENLVKLHKRKTHTQKMFRLSWSLKLSDLYTLGLWQFINYSLVFPALVLVPGKSLPRGFCSDELWFSVSTCLSLLICVCCGEEGSSLPCELISLMELRRIVYFFSL